MRVLRRRVHLVDEERKLSLKVVECHDCSPPQAVLVMSGRTIDKAAKEVSMAGVDCGRRHFPGIVSLPRALGGMRQWKN